MNRRISILVIIFCATVLFAAATLIVSAAMAAGETDTSAEAGAAQQGPIPAAQIPRAVTDAVNSPGRPAVDKELDVGRRPEQILAFLGIRPGMKVADLWAGGGYMTELLARTVGPSGKVFSQNGMFPRASRKARTHGRRGSRSLA